MDPNQYDLCPYEIIGTQKTHTKGNLMRIQMEGHGSHVLTKEKGPRMKPTLSFGVMVNIQARAQPWKSHTEF